MTFTQFAWLTAVTIPHILYLYAYHYGPSLQAIIPHKEFVNLAIILRAVSIGATFILFQQTLFHTWSIYEWFSPYPLAFLGIVLMLIGITINKIVYAELGVSGVYYACEMIQECHFIDSYIFKILDHPMYVGAIITILGGICLAGFDEDKRPRPRVIIPFMYMIALYMFTMFVESHPPTQKMIPHKD